MLFIMAVNVKTDGHLQAKNPNQEKAAQYQEWVNRSVILDEADD